MAWTTPRSWAAGELVTASLMNTQLRDNLREVGVLLARTAYNPGTQSSYTRTSSTFADVDATNLSAAFTVPQSGKVLVCLNTLGKSAATASMLRWNVRDGAADVAGTDEGITNQNQGDWRHSYNAIITGLTAGASKTYKWGFASSDNATTVTMYAGGTDKGPATMEVWQVT